MDDSPPPLLLGLLVIIAGLTVCLAYFRWQARREGKEFNILRILTMTGLAIAVGSVPFLAAWFIYPGNWNLLGAAVVAPLVLVYALGIIKLIHHLREKKSKGNSSCP